MSIRQELEEELQPILEEVIGIIETNPNNPCKLNRVKDELDTILAELCCFEYDQELPQELLDKEREVVIKARMVINEYK